MKRSSVSTIRGKLVSRTLLTALIPILLIGGITLAALRSFSASAEDSAASARRAIGDGPALAPLDDFVADVSSASNRVTILLVLVIIVAAVGAAALAMTLARRITSPIAQLRTNAATAVEVTLPEFVAQIDSFVESGSEAPEIKSLLVPSGDEVEDLADSFNKMQLTAASLAMEQARTRHQSVATFVNLGRRNQNLLARQIEAINSMEQVETDPQALERLFHLDHLATRMRRNAQSLLVLADEESPRRFRKPVSMHQLVQAASGEIEYFDRVACNVFDEVYVDGGPASDLAHLLAELLENATSFAPPGSEVEVTGRTVDAGYELQILDRGIGMDADGLTLANKRLADDTNFRFSESTTFLGHFVVGRLAKRHGVHVELAATTPTGVSAHVLLPTALLAADPSDSSSPQTVASSTDAASPPFGATTPSLDQEPTPAFEPDAASSARTNGAAASTQPASEPRPLPDQPSAAAADAPLVAPSIKTDGEPEVEISSDEFARLEAIEWALRSSPDTPLEAVRPGPRPVASATAGPISAAPQQTPGAGISPATTPAGFRKRRRGEEGAPQSLGQDRHEPVRVRRSPEEVQAALQRFSIGVETGRAASADPTHSVVDPQANTEESTFAGDNS